MSAGEPIVIRPLGGAGLRESPSVFLCVSSFNAGAQGLYRRLGYTVVGELTDYLVRGHGEVLMRKSRGPWSEFRPAG